MNKRKVDELIPKAYTVLEEVCIVKSNGKIPKGWRGQIASFGAAIATGSLLSAVAFFNKQGGAAVERELLVKAIEKLIANDGKLFDYVKAQPERKAKEEIINAAIALKLAMNLYEWEK